MDASVIASLVFQEPGQYICKRLQDIDLIVRACSQLIQVGIRNDEVVTYVQYKLADWST